MANEPSTPNDDKTTDAPTERIPADEVAPVIAPVIPLTAPGEPFYDQNDGSFHA